MINKDRIVPVQATDLITLYAVILKQDTTNNSTLAKVDAANAEGECGEFERIFHHDISSLINYFLQTSLNSATTPGFMVSLMRTGTARTVTMKWVFSILVVVVPKIYFSTGNSHSTGTPMV